MCKAFSCLIGKDKKVTWKFGVDEHHRLVEIADYKDDTSDTQKLEFARVEIAPTNGSYLKPDEWLLKVDEKIRPDWFSPAHEAACWKEHKIWKKKLYSILVQKEIVHPLKITPPKIGKKQIKLLKDVASVRVSVGDSVRASVWASVGDSVWDSVWASVGDSVRASVWDSVGDSVRASVWASVGAYTGSFFKLDRKDWKYTEKIKTKGYPFQAYVTLWEMGLVPSFDGKVWRLHGGKDGKILLEISKEELAKRIEEK